MAGEHSTTEPTMLSYYSAIKVTIYSDDFLKLKVELKYLKDDCNILSTRISNLEKERKTKFEKTHNRKRKAV